MSDSNATASAPQPFTPTADDWADVAAAQAEAHTQRSELYQLLLDWARESLASPAVPCVCLNGHCLRCRVQRIVGDDRPYPLPGDDRLVKIVGE
jgi:hypothetical protein